MNIKEHYDSLVRGLTIVQRDKNIEFEGLLKKNIEHKISLTDFNNIIANIKGIPGIKLQSSGETLDIFIPDNNDNLRYTIHGNQAINFYCKTNNLGDLKSGTYSLIRKKLVEKIDINNYNVRVNIKSEEPQRIDLEVFNDWNSLNKIFRYKKRFSFITQDNLFSFDLSVIKSSNKNITKLETTKKKKKDIKKSMEKFIIKPKNVTNFREWYSKVRYDEYVELVGKTIEKFIPSKSLQASNTLNNPVEYEVELEYLGNKFDYKEKHDIILNKFISNFGIILQALQNNYFIISQKEKADVRKEYKDLFKYLKFMGPQPATLEMKHVTRKNYSDYNSILSIRRNYCVTDKADGERNLLHILKNGKVYMINRKMEIKYLGCKIPEFANSVLDGEYIKQDKNGKNIILFAVFDVYFFKGEDFRANIFNRSDEEKELNKIKVSRYEKLNEIFENMKVIVDNSEDNIMIIKKKFYFGDVVEYDKNVDTEIIRLESELKLLEKNGTQYNDLLKYINTMKADTSIFSESQKVYSKEYIYKIDGLIYTPINLKVGENLDDNVHRYEGRWLSCFKWKPPEENTIDFKVSFKKDPDNNNIDWIKYISRDDEIIPYKILQLSVGYDTEIHTKINSCRVLNEELTFKEGYHNTLFQPSNPYIKNIELAYISLVNDTPYCENKNIIKEGDIVEFRYNPKKEEGFWWEPMKTRNVNNPNDFMTAINNWRTIHNPILMSMITGGNIPDNDEVYYFKNIERKNLSTKPMADFHLYVKKTLITKNCKSSKSLLDLGSGRAGDLNHWLDCNFEFIVTLDINRYNLENTNSGGCNRVLSTIKTKKNRVLNNILFIWGDASKNIISGDAAKDDLNKYYLDVLNGNIDKALINNSKLQRLYNIAGNKYNTISAQFCFHYFFENDKKLHNLFRNVSENLKSDGVFIGTCLDGKKVFNELKGKTSIVEYNPQNNDEILWKLVKIYKEDDFRNDETSIGYPIDVYINSIGKTTTEWLVNFDYLKIKCLEHDLELTELKNFGDMFNILKDSKKQYGDAVKMKDNLKRLSFMHTCFVFTKK